MEFFQEDIDAMQIESLMWQNAYTVAAEEIEKEQSQTEKMLEKFKYELIKIQENINETIEQINNTTSNIIQNEEKISKLVANL